ncbi:hypothetical protein A2V56_00810 [Candidatus Woesebacteria bacterium RBG_19FT_COMBO_42_9]|uniref:Membrane protein 6-pyruvoyl-tetrahydropterin synthase-related domain-containing protein n=1 Tax=Candidatus Woesebacteria bacterium RBG_16_42_24 TaxID=1802485 RepID=A0A1F7XKE5_9BACT|nr:MAG: hypothetical protein A2V97_02465 [Candidatus Woesebacteria bacterium RBG_16_42_24]OGM17706.1 MAG: hypothetical protein A2V56_00810 [Candidatus Woesebacteria bacterium RBG_19FT_COMBO_42_9]
MKKFLPTILILLLLIPAIRALFGPGYFNMHDDLQVMRIFQMEKCFADGQIPCRWAPDMAYGYGQAMFNYYSALPYYLGVLIRVLTPLSLMGTVKLLFMISLVAGAYGMYFLAKEFWGRRGGVLAAVFYTYAPYHAVDVYVRGAMAESFSLAILPFLWWSIYLLIKKASFLRVAAAAIATAAILTTHNISTMIYFPFTAVWAAFWLIKFRALRQIPKLVFAAFVGLGLSAFFIGPAIFEQSLIQTQHLISEYSDYHGHFVTLRQLFISRFWGDGPSIFGEGDGMSFQVGWPHWWVGVLVAPLIIVWAKRKKNLDKAILLTGFLGFFAMASFLTHPRSFFIWEAIPLMAFIQFPWRFLGLSMFFLALGAGALGLLEAKWAKFFMVVSVVAGIILNWNFFIPVNFSSKVKDEEKLRGLAFELQQKSAILDYLPKTAKIAPPSLAFEAPRTISGNGDFFGFTKGSNRFSFEAQIYGEARVEIPVMYFPGWVVLVDGKKVAVEIHDTYGFIMVDLEDGRHILRGRFINTSVRTVSNAFSVISALGLFGACLVWESRKRKE